MLKGNLSENYCQLNTSIFWDMKIQKNLQMFDMEVS